MALTRTQRQRAARTSAVRPVTYSPKVDAFGTVHAGSASEYKARVLEYAPGHIAIFRDVAPTNPVLIETVSPISIKGRIMRTTFLIDDEELELVFQKAGCGCETPQSLRGGRNKLVREAGIEETV